MQRTFGVPGFLVLSILQFLYPFIGKWLQKYSFVSTQYLNILAFYSILFELEHGRGDFIGCNVALKGFSFSSPAMISYNITTGDTLTKVFQRIPGGSHNTLQVSPTHCQLSTINA